VRVLGSRACACAIEGRLSGRVREGERKRIHLGRSQRRRARRPSLALVRRYQCVSTQQHHDSRFKLRCVDILCKHGCITFERLTYGKCQMSHVYPCAVCVRSCTQATRALAAWGQTIFGAHTHCDVKSFETRTHTTHTTSLRSCSPLSFSLLSLSTPPPLLSLPCSLLSLSLSHSLSLSLSVSAEGRRKQTDPRCVHTRADATQSRLILVLTPVYVQRARQFACQHACA